MCFFYSGFTGLCSQFYFYLQFVVNRCIESRRRFKWQGQTAENCVFCLKIQWKNRWFNVALFFPNFLKNSFTFFPTNITNSTLSHFTRFYCVFAGQRSSNLRVLQPSKIAFQRTQRTNVFDIFFLTRNENVWKVCMFWFYGWFYRPGPISLYTAWFYHHHLKKGGFCSKIRVSQHFFYCSSKFDIFHVIFSPSKYFWYLSRFLSGSQKIMIFIWLRPFLLYFSFDISSMTFVLLILKGCAIIQQLA